MLVDQYPLISAMIETIGPMQLFIIYFRRFLQLLSAGFFLPGSAGIVDPCEIGVRVHTAMSLEEQDQVTIKQRLFARIPCINSNSF